MKAIPLERPETAEFIKSLHRHHPPAHADKYRIGCEIDGKTLEVLRLCTDGSPNVCSFLYSRAARVAKELGYRKIITYILDSENGDSLKATGWHKEADTQGKHWNCPSRPRETNAPTCNKQRWAKELQGGRQ